ncbi:MAG: ATP-binding protein, partial [Candidatus Cloacimonadota bacterium]|nr:ATP-binding protein [Candidatus Cloacimonadota bacterium]
LTKIDLGKLKIEKQEIDLNKVAKSVFESVRPLIHNSSQNLKLEISDSSEIVFIDESRIRQVVLNLVSNAIKFCPSGDIVISTESDPQYNIISVYDTGIGLDKDEIEKIFKDFEQANSSISSNFGGTGLGLSISRKIVLLHNGKITVKSKKGVFTKFSVLLPKQKNKKNTVSKNSEEAQKLLKEKILVLDDDTSFSGIIEKFLHFVNYRVKIISNPVKSVKEALDFKPDLLITDIMMPVMDGLQVVQKFRENPDLKDIKIITISGYLDSELTKLIDADGALQKPFRKEELFNLIRKVLDRSEDK